MVILPRQSSFALQILNFTLQPSEIIKPIFVILTAWCITKSIEDKKIAEGEKEYVNKRKQIRKKLLKFNNRIPVFMYLTDYREETLEDVITQIDKKLFTKVTNITQPVFRKLVSIGVFPRSKMNKHVLSFRNVENNSLEYLGVDSHISDKIGGWDVKINKSDLPDST